MVAFACGFLFSLRIGCEGGGIFLRGMDGMECGNIGMWDWDSQ